MDRTCYKCSKIKPLDNFKKNKHLSLGHGYCCKVCHRKYYNGNPLNRRLHRVFHDIKRRCNNKDGKHPSYANIECKLTASEFIEWATPFYKQFIIEHPNETPSVHRIRNHDHYQLDNLKIIPLSENSKLSHHPDNIEDICKVVQRMSNFANIPLLDIANKLIQIVKDQGV